MNPVQYSLERDGKESSTAGAALVAQPVLQALRPFDLMALIWTKIRQNDMARGALIAALGR